MVNMNKRFMFAGLVALAAAQAPPSPVLLTATKSGVDPIVPTPFNGVETIEGAIIYDGPAIEGFTGLFILSHITDRTQRSDFNNL
jgi:hypothetical protein